MSKNHFTKKGDRRLRRIVASFGGRPVRWREVETQFNDKLHKQSRRSAASLQARWRTLQKKAKQESLKRIAQKDGFKPWLTKLLTYIKALHKQKKKGEAKIAELEKRNKTLEKERDKAVRELEEHLAKDKRIRDAATRRAQAALVVSGD